MKSWTMCEYAPVEWVLRLHLHNKCWKAFQYFENYKCIWKLNIPNNVGRKLFIFPAYLQARSHQARWTCWEHTVDFVFKKYKCWFHIFMHIETKDWWLMIIWVYSLSWSHCWTNSFREWITTTLLVYRMVWVRPTLFKADIIFCLVSAPKTMILIHFIDLILLSDTELPPNGEWTY